MIQEVKMQINGMTATHTLLDFEFLHIRCILPETKKCSLRANQAVFCQERAVTEVSVLAPADHVVNGLGCPLDGEIFLVCANGWVT